MECFKCFYCQKEIERTKQYPVPVVFDDEELIVPACKDCYYEVYSDYFED